MHLVRRDAGLVQVLTSEYARTRQTAEPLAAARERFAVAATDLLLPDQARLTEWQRLTFRDRLAATTRYTICVEPVRL
mgnify:CR=1 FL=1